MFSPEHFRNYMFFRRPRITADYITTDYEMDEAASGAVSLILSKTCRCHIALDEMLFDQHFVSASGGSQCCTFEGFLRKPCSTRFECIKHSKI